jgi:hypothetical protein
MFEVRIPLTTREIFEGICGPNGVASLMPASWNQIAFWLKQIDGLRQVA